MNQKIGVSIVLLMLLPIVYAPPTPDDVFTITEMKVGDVIEIKKQDEWCSSTRIQIVQMGDTQIKLSRYNRVSQYYCYPEYNWIEANTGYDPSEYILDANSTLKFEKVEGSFGTKRIRATITAEAGHFADVSLTSCVERDFTVQKGDTISIVKEGEWVPITDTVKITRVAATWMGFNVERTEEGETYTIAENIQVPYDKMIYKPTDFGNFIVFWCEKKSENTVLTHFRYIDTPLDVQIYKGTSTPPSENGTSSPESVNEIDWKNIREGGYIIIDAPEQTNKVTKTIKFEYTGNELRDLIEAQWKNPGQQVSNHDWTEYVSTPTISTSTLGQAATSGEISFGVAFPIPSEGEQPKDWQMFTLQVYQDLPSPVLLGEVNVWLRRTEPTFILSMESPEQEYTGNSWTFTLKKGDTLASTSDISRIEVDGQPRDVQNPFTYTPSTKGVHEVSFVARNKEYSKTLYAEERPCSPEYAINISPSREVDIGSQVSINLINRSACAPALTPQDIGVVQCTGALSHSFSGKLSETISADSAGEVTVTATIKGTQVTETFTIVKPQVNFTATQPAGRSQIQIKLLDPKSATVKVYYREGTVFEQQVDNEQVIGVPTLDTPYSVTVTPLAADAENYASRTANVMVTGGGNGEVKPSLAEYVGVSHSEDDNEIVVMVKDVKDVEVRAKKQEGDRWKTVSFDEMDGTQGRYVINEPDPGAYKIYVNKEGYQGYEREITVEGWTLPMSWTRLVMILGGISVVLFVGMYHWKRGISNPFKRRPPKRRPETPEKQEATETRITEGEQESGVRDIGDFLG